MKSFIRDVGFPIVAFFLMYWVCFQSLAKQTVAIEQLTNVIQLSRMDQQNFKDSFDRFMQRR